MNCVQGKERILLKHLYTLAMLIHDRKIGGLYKSPPYQLPITSSNILITSLPKIILHTAAKQDVCVT